MKYMILTLNEEKYWLEVEEDNYANRQIILDEYKQFHISCMEECLAEGPIEESDLEGDIRYLTKL